MQCSTCGYANRDDARFCGGCGTPLVRKRACSTCGRENAATQKFCDGCGTPLEESTAGAQPDPRTYTPPDLAERILTVRSAVEGERKHVTVLFADVAGYTSLAEHIDPEEVHALMNRCFKLILEPVHRYEGTVNQFTGDGVMALFGAPIALEDAPRRAVMAALDIQQALKPLGEDVKARHGCDFRMRIGIHSGLVVVGKIGDDLRMEYTALGDTTNLANRLQTLAQPGSIVISEATQRLVAGYFNVHDLGEVMVKGRTTPVHAFEVTAEREVAGRIEAIGAQGLTPYVGRVRELAQLETAFDAASASRGQVVWVVGEAGIGKSRLLHEFQQLVADRPHVRLEGHCASYARTTAFYCIADALRRAFGITDRDDETTAAAKIDAAERLAGGGLEWTLPLVRGLLSLPIRDEPTSAMDAITRRSETFRALQAYFLRAAERQPIVVVIEDLHWIDSGSEEFLTFLADSLPAAKAMLLLTHRPGYRHTLGDRSYHVRLALQPLTEKETERIAARVLESEHIPPELRDVIVAKAEGNPFFIEEVTKSLLEEGALRHGAGGIELARDLTTIAIPDSVQDVIMARIDRLDDEPKRAIQVAAIIGREFAMRLLDRIVVAGDRVSELLTELRTLELIYEKAVHPELAFMFKHALTHDVAYESVLLQKRKALHALVGEAIEELYADRLAEHYESLAHHFALGERWDKALDYHERAARKAVAAYANHAAADHYRQAIEIARELGDAVTPERYGTLLDELSNVLWCLNEFRAAGEASRAAAEAAPDPEERSLRLSRASWCYHWGHDYELARQAVDEASATARRHGSHVAEIFAGLMKAFADVTVSGDPAIGAEWFDAAARLEASDGRHAMVKVTADFFAAENAEWSDDFRSALSVYERLLDSGSLQRDPLMVAHAEWFAGKAATCLGRYDHALARMHGGADRAMRVGDRAMQSRLLNTLGWCYAEFGCDLVAVEYNTRATEIGRELVDLQLVAGAPELYGNAAVNLAGNRIVLGELGGADEVIASVEADLAHSSDPWMRWRYGMHVLNVRARFLMACGDPEKALPLVDAQVEAARRHRAAKIQARALELRGRALLALERGDDAEATLLDAIGLARRIGYPPTVWRSLALLAERARRAGKSEQSRRWSADASSVIDGLVPNLSDERLRGGLRDFAARALADPMAALR